MIVLLKVHIDLLKNSFERAVNVSKESLSNFKNIDHSSLSKEEKKLEKKFMKL